MAEGPRTISISTGLEHRPVAGADTIILKLPSAFYVDPGDGKADLALVPLLDYLREHAQAQASDMGEDLHHAEFVITLDPGVVRDRGLLHYCADCLAAVEEAVAFMGANPDQWMVVGRIFWAGR